MSYKKMPGIAPGIFVSGFPGGAIGESAILTG